MADPNNLNINFSDPTGITDSFKKLVEQIKISSESFKYGFENLEGGALALNKQFGQSRQRITELKLAVADATPVVDRLGGTLYDAVETTRQISEATRRNVVASTEDIGKLYAAGQILDTGVSTIVENFQDVGIQFSQVGEQLKNSIEYIGSVGVNTKAVMDKVFENMSQMNRFNFQDGVQGLTKMATQATLLKFDMSQVFTLADKALDPQGAIELSSAFQRLGLAAGGLTDPFELMYKSLNDPEGLQNSLVEMTKQFTYFDEQTKSFKISPAGMLQLRELQKETGLSASEMSKLALNTADLDRKLSMIKSDIKFGSEEDKMYLANIAKLDKEGNYKVEFVDEQGTKVSKNIEDLTQDQIDLLIQQEKDRPKDLEGIQRSQLQNIEVMGGDLRAIRDKLVYGTVSAPKLTMLAEDMGKIGTIITDNLNEGVDQSKVQGTVNQAMKEVRDIFKDIAAGKKVDWTDLTELSKKTFDIDKVKERIMDVLPQVRQDIPERIKNRYDIPENLSDVASKLFDMMKTEATKSETQQMPKGQKGTIPTTQMPKEQKGTTITSQMPVGTKNIDPNIPITSMNVETFKVGDTTLNDLLEKIVSKTQKITIDGIDIPSRNFMTAQQAVLKGPLNDYQTLHKHTFDGTINFKLAVPPGWNENEFYAMIDKPKFKETITKYLEENRKETEGRPIQARA